MKNKLLILMVMVLLIIPIVYSIVPYPASNPFNATHHWDFNDDCVDNIGGIDCTVNGVLVYNTTTILDTGKSVCSNGNAANYLDLNIRPYLDGKEWTFCYWTSLSANVEGSTLWGAVNGGAGATIVHQINTGATRYPMLQAEKTAANQIYFNVPNVAYSNIVKEHNFNFVCVQHNSTDTARYQAYIVNGTRILDNGAGVYGNPDNVPLDIDMYFFCYDNSGTCAGPVTGCVDDMLFWNDTTAQPTISNLLDIYTGTYAGGPAGGGINVTITSPLNDTSFGVGTKRIWINLTHNETGAWVATINDTDWTLNSNTSSEAYFLNNTALSSGNYHVKVFVNKTGTSNGTDNVQFYLDTVIPQITTQFVNGTIFYNRNLTGFFNFSDDFSLFSYNISIDDVKIDLKTGLGTTLYQLNLSYSISNLTSGTHNLGLRIADGHTALYAEPANKITDGLLNNYLRYDYGNEYIKISSGLLDTFSTKKEYDRYTFEYDPNFKLNSYDFYVESNDKVYIMDMLDTYLKKWIVVGNHWVDFDLGKETTIVTERINDYKVKVTVSGSLNSMDKLSFNSVGDLNIITKEYTFNIINSTITYEKDLLEREIGTYTLTIGKNDSEVSTDAAFIFGGNYYDSTKTSSALQDVYSIDYSHPIITAPLLNKTYGHNWTFNYTKGGVTSSNYQTNNTIIVSRMILGNCYNDTYNQTAINFSVLDANTNAVINSFAFEASFTLFNSENSSYTRTYGFENSSMDVYSEVCMFPYYGKFYSDYDTLFSHANYDDTHYIVGDGPLNSTTKNVNVYMVNSSLATGITVKVIDQSGTALPGYITEAHRYNIATNDYTLITTQYSDSNGEAKFYLDVTTYEYRFTVKNSGGETVYVEPKQKLISTSYTFSIPIGDSPDIIEFALNKLNYELTANKATKTFSLNWNEISYLASRINLTVYMGNSTDGSTTISNQYSNLNTGSLTYIITDNTTLKSVTYTAVVKITALEDGKDYYVDTVTIDFKKAWEVFGTEALLMTFIFVGTMIFIGLAVSPILALVAAIFSMVILWWLGFYVVSATALISVIILLIVIIARLNR